MITQTGGADIESSELRDFSRTVAEIEWLLVILVLLYQVVQHRGADNSVPIYSGVAAYSAIIIGIHYLNFVRKPGRWSLAFETWLMIVFITYVLFHTGRVDSPLLNLYLLPIVTSALTLGQKATLLQVGLVAACYLLLGHASNPAFLTTMSAGDFVLALSPMLLVAYITTVLSQDILNTMAKIKLLSETDALTGAFNMRAFNTIAARECGLAERHRRILSLLMVDSDNLKKVNDTHGHDAGDALIKHVAKSIQHELRVTDIVARYGGDEFMCLLPETGAPGAAIVAERIRKRIAESPIAALTESIPTSVSIGIAAFPEHGARFEIIARNADRALYLSKAQGRNRVTVFSPG